MIHLLIVIVIVGAVLYFVNKNIAMEPPYKSGMNLIAAICILLYALKVFGILGGGNALSP